MATQSTTGESPRETTEREIREAREALIAKVIRAGKKPLRRCLTMHECFWCKGTIYLSEYYRDGGYGSRIHETCYAKVCDEVPRQEHHV